MCPKVTTASRPPADHRPAIPAVKRQRVLSARDHAPHEERQRHRRAAGQPALWGTAPLSAVRLIARLKNSTTPPVEPQIGRLDRGRLPCQVISGVSVHAPTDTPLGEGPAPTDHHPSGAPWLRRRRTHPLRTTDQRSALAQVAQLEPERVTLARLPALIARSQSHSSTEAAVRLSHPLHPLSTSQLVATTRPVGR